MRRNGLSSPVREKGMDSRCAVEGGGSSVGARGGFGIKMRLFEFQHLDLEGVNSHCPLPGWRTGGGGRGRGGRSGELKFREHRRCAVGEGGERERALGNKYAQFRHLDITCPH